LSRVSRLISGDQSRADVTDVGESGSCANEAVDPLAQFKSGDLSEFIGFDYRDRRKARYSLRLTSAANAAGDAF
jgi:hypothetical protein